MTYQPYDHNAVPAYYPRPVDISDDEWDRSFFSINGRWMYTGLRRDGLWTLETLDRAMKWQHRRKMGIPYVHQVPCTEGDPCWVVEFDGLQSDHYRTHGHAIRCAERVLKNYTPAQRARVKIAAAQRIVSSLGVDLW